MYINRTEPRLRAETTTRRSVVRKDNQNGDSFSDTMASVLEIDVVQVGDSTDDEQKRQQAPSQQKKKHEEETPVDAALKPSSLDIKV